MVFNFKLVKRQRLNACLFIFAILCLIAYPSARTIGAIHQTKRGNAIVKVRNMKK